MKCERDGHVFIQTEPAHCMECGVTLSKYDLIRSRAGRVFIVGTLNEAEQAEFDKAHRRGRLKAMESLMKRAFLRLGIDITKEQSQLWRQDT